MKNFDIKKMMIDNLALSIAFSIVWTILQGIWVLLGVKDYTLPVLLLGCVVMAVMLWLVMLATFMLLNLFKEVSDKIRKRKLKQKINKIEICKGETVDKHAKNLGLQRKPEETDDELKRRCQNAVVLKELERNFKEHYNI